MQRTIKTLLGTVALLGLATFAQAQTLTSASEQAERDLKAAVTELSETRATRAAEKSPLIREFSAL